MMTFHNVISFVCLFSFNITNETKIKYRLDMLIVRRFFFEIKLLHTCWVIRATQSSVSLYTML